MPPFTACVVQTPSYPYDKAGNLQRALDTMETAAAQGAVYIYTMRIGEHRINHLMKKYGGMMEFHETLPL